MTIQKAYEKAGLLHGHYCPGLAIGVRAAWEGRKAVGDENNNLCCLAERSACWLDGFCLIGATVANGKLKLHDTGKVAFSIYNPDSGKSVRLLLKAGPAGMSRDETTQWLLTAPLEDVFSVGETRVPFPPYQPAPGDVLCSVCGEPVMESKIHVKDGKFVCCDCL